MSRLHRYLYGTVFLTGAAVLILEVTAVRVLSPYYGSSLYVFSSVLTVVLAALSIGYWYGGKRADKEQSLDSLYTIITISGLVVLGLLLASMVLLPEIGPFLSVTVGPLIFSLVLFFAPAFLLGIVSPYIIKLQSIHSPAEKIGEVVGNTFFWGTMGSIVGSLATGFWLIPTLGIQQTLTLVSVALISLGLVTPLFLNRPLRKNFIAKIVFVALIIGGIIYAFDTSTNSGVVYKGDGLYSAIKIQDLTLNERPVRLLLRDTNNSSAIFHDSNDLVFAYTQFAELYPVLKPNTKDILVLGGGAYTIPRTLTEKDPALSVDVVEIEPILFDLAQKYFDLRDTSRITNYSMDARVFLSQANEQYDLIFSDTFGTDLAAPFHLTTHEFYELAKKSLADEGIFILNYVGKPEAPTPSLTGSIIKTILATFPNTRAFGLENEEPTNLQNIMFISRNGESVIDVSDATVTNLNGEEKVIAELELPLNNYLLEDEILLTDDRAPVEYLMAKQQ